MPGHYLESCVPRSRSLIRFRKYPANVEIMDPMTEYTILLRQPELDSVVLCCAEWHPTQVTRFTVADLRMLEAESWNDEDCVWERVP